jgi:hypothetical protein
MRPAPLSRCIARRAGGMVVNFTSRANAKSSSHAARRLMAEDVVPFVKSHYRISEGAENTGVRIREKMKLFKSCIPSLAAWRRLRICRKRRGLLR